MLLITCKSQNEAPIRDEILSLTYSVHRKSISGWLSLDMVHLSSSKTSSPSVHTQPSGSTRVQNFSPPSPYHHFTTCTVIKSTLTIPEDSASGRAAMRAWWVGYSISFCKIDKERGVKDRSANRSALPQELGHFTWSLALSFFFFFFFTLFCQLCNFR